MVLRVGNSKTIGGNTEFNVYLRERNLYGSSRLGQEQLNMQMGITGYQYAGVLAHEVGDKRYELSNHLGNVLQVVRDAKLPVITQQNTASITFVNATGVSVSGNNLTKTAATGWGNAGAVSQQTVLADQYLEWELCSDISASLLRLTCVGLSYSSDPADNNYTTIRYGWMVGNNGLLHTSKSGTISSSSYGTATGGMKLRLERKEGRVWFYIDGQLQTSIIEPNPSSPMIADVAINRQGGKVCGVVKGNIVKFNHYLADVESFSDYYPYGMQLTGMHGTESSDGYRYGFQAQEKDDEVKGAGNSVNYTYRMHDPRLGRFFAIDPLTAKYPHNSPYAFSENVVINAVELEGLERRYTFNSIHTTQKFMSVYEGFQKGTKTFGDITAFLESKRGYRMSDGSVSAVRGKLGRGKENEQLGLDNSKGVPYVASSDDISNENYIIVSIITQTKDGDYDRKSFEIVKDGYTPDNGSAYPVMARERGLFDEGADDPANTGGSYSGVKGMYKAGSDLNTLGDALSYIPTPPTQALGKIYQGMGDVLTTIADYNTLETQDANRNLAIRLVTFGVGEKISKDLKNTISDGSQRYVGDQFVRKSLDGIKDQSTVKPKK